jgi:hypothetical protein
VAKTPADTSPLLSHGIFFWGLFRLSRIRPEVQGRIEGRAHSHQPLQVRGISDGGYLVCLPKPLRNPPQRRTMGVSRVSGFPVQGRNASPGMVSPGRRISDRRLELTDKLKGKLQSTDDFQLSPDLQTMTETQHHADQGKPIILVFKRE